MSTELHFPLYTVLNIIIFFLSFTIFIIALLNLKNIDKVDKIIRKKSQNISIILSVASGFAMISTVIIEILIWKLFVSPESLTKLCLQYIYLPILALFISTLFLSNVNYTEYNLKNVIVPIIFIIEFLLIYIVLLSRQIIYNQYYNYHD